MFPKDYKTVDWLCWFTFTDPEDRLPKPFRISETERAATNGRYCVISTDDVPCEPIADRAESIISHTRGFFDEKNMGKKSNFTRAELVELFGECQHPSTDNCENCKGKKMSTHYCDCEFCEVDKEPCGNCDGTGHCMVTPEPRHVLIFGKPFNGNFVAYILEHIPESEQSFDVCLIKEKSDSAMVAFVGDKVKVVLLQMVLSKELLHEEKSLPHLKHPARPQKPSPAAS